MKLAIAHTQGQAFTSSRPGEWAVARGDLRSSLNRAIQLFAQRMCVLYCPQHQLLCQLGLYPSVRVRVGLRDS
jgi:hypothetical protein